MISRSTGDVHDDLRRFPFLQKVEALVKALERQDVRDDRREIDAAGYDEGLRLIPRLEHPAPVDAENGQSFEDDVLGEIDAHVVGWKSEQRRSSSVADEAETLIDGSAAAAHLEQDVGAVSVRLLEDPLLQAFNARVEDAIRTEPLCQLELAGIDIDRDDLRRAGRARDGDRHEPDRADARDDDALRADARSHDGVNSVAERVEHGCPRIRNGRVELPDIVLGHRDVIGETAVAIDADDLDVFADVRLSGAAQVTDAARDVALCRYAVADLHGTHGCADLCDLAHEFVADDKRRLHARLRPLIPVPDVPVGSADAGFADADEDVGRPDRRHRDVFQYHAW